MGLIKAISGGIGGTLADQWKEFIYCDALPADVLVQKGQKRITGRSSNTKGEENIITDGSRVAVNEGQVMLIVENGKIVDFCAEAGGIHLPDRHRALHVGQRLEGAAGELPGGGQAVHLRRPGGA